MTHRIKRATAAIALCLATVSIAAAHADSVRGGRGNIAGGVTTGGAHDVRGPFGGRTFGEGGAVTNGDGAGLSGSRGCARVASGARGCGRGSTSWDGDGNVSHEQNGAARGAFGNTAVSSGSWERDSNGDVSGARDTDVRIGDRTYSAETTFESGSGFDRQVTCSAGCN